VPGKNGRPPSSQSLVHRPGFLDGTWKGKGREKGREKGLTAGSWSGIVWAMQQQEETIYLFENVVNKIFVAISQIEKLVKLFPRIEVIIIRALLFGCFLLGIHRLVILVLLTGL
jgi:hypothetical protein